MASRISEIHGVADEFLKKGAEADRDGNEVMAYQYYEFAYRLCEKGLLVAARMRTISHAGQSQVDELKKWKGYLKIELKRAERSPETDIDAARFEKRIEGEIMLARDDTTFKDIAGMKHVKVALTEMIILPSVRSDIYTGIRTPLRGLLLFGPPGNGKTYIARAVANEVNATFFSISATAFASSLVGDAENLLKALFTVARRKQPSLIFIDEIDSILTKRCENDQEHTHKLKTEFLVQFDGVATDRSDNVTVIGATNVPDELDDAARHRFDKRIYVGLPDKLTRRQLFDVELRQNNLANDLNSHQIEELVHKTRGYSASDLKSLCKEAAMMPLRKLKGGILTVKAEDIEKVENADFLKALVAIKPSVKTSSLKHLEDWNTKFGSIPNGVLT